MKMFFLGLIITQFLLGFNCISAAQTAPYSPIDLVQIIEWRPFSSSSKVYLLPKLPNETNEIAISAYLDAIASSVELKDYAFSETELDKVNSSAQTINSSDKTKGQVVLLANSTKDHQRLGPRVHNFIEPFLKAGLRPAILPVGATLRLSPSQKASMNYQIANHFQTMVAMGGDDVDPSRYGEEKTHAVNTNATRDRLEIEIIKSYIDKRTGFFWGVCRGHQITSVALGLKLVQDIYIENKIEHNHRSENHDIKIIETKYNLLEKMLGLNGSAPVNSYHHQAVSIQSFKGSKAVSLSALSPDGLIEALEFNNGKGLLTQFHPELMKNSIGELFMSRISNPLIQKAKLCRKVF